MNFLSVLFLLYPIADRFGGLHVNLVNLVFFLGLKCSVLQSLNLTFVPLDEMGPTGKGHKSQSARDFVSFYNEVKEKKVHITNKDILKFSKLFEVTATF